MLEILVSGVMDKADVARRQLGTALHLFLQGADPVSVHCLACGGGEIAEWLVKSEHKDAYVDHLTGGPLPAFDLQTFRQKRNARWNSFKHATKMDGQTRDDMELFSDFTKYHAEYNEEAIFIGWFDYGMVLPRPIEAKMFEAWYFAKYPEAFSAEARAILTVGWPNLPKLKPYAQIELLKQKNMVAKIDPMMVDLQDIDSRPLLLP